MSRLSVLHINIIGVVVALIVAGALYFTLITSAQDAIKKNQTDFDAVKARADKFDTAQRNLKKANEDKRKAEQEYARLEAKYMPILGYKATRLDTMTQVFWPNNGKSWPERFIRTVKMHMAREAKNNKLTWNNPDVLALGPFGPDPNTIDAASPGEGLAGPLRYRFPISVTARTLDSVLRHIQSWEKMTGAGVPVVEGLQLAGNSPNLQADYTLTLTIIVRDKVPPAQNRITGGGGGGGRMGGVMGMGGMMPGMMMSGGPAGMGVGGPRGGRATMGAGGFSRPGMAGGPAAGGGGPRGGGRRGDD